MFSDCDTGSGSENAEIIFFNRVGDQCLRSRTSALGHMADSPSFIHSLIQLMFINTCFGPLIGTKEGKKANRKQQ